MMLGPHADASGAIIAGGTSRRLGTDKRLVRVEGQTLLARSVTTLRAVVDDLHVVIASDADRDVVRTALGPANMPGPSVAIESDLRPGEGPAAGLETALAVARHEIVLVVATDHPWLSPAVLGLLLERAVNSSAMAVALEGSRGPEPLLAVYRRDALVQVRACLDAGTRRLQDVLSTLHPTTVSSEEWRALDPQGLILEDVDSPADLRRLESRAAPRRGRSCEPSAGT